MSTLVVNRRSRPESQDPPFEVPRETNWQVDCLASPLVEPLVLIVFGSRSPSWDKWRENALANVLDSSVEAVELVSELYEFRDYTAVAMFLRQNPFLASLLLEAYGQIEKHFGMGTQTVLEVFADPEAENDRQLFVLIQTRRTPKEALACLRALDREWWLGVLPMAQHKMTIDVEYN